MYFPLYAFVWPALFLAAPCRSTLLAHHRLSSFTPCEQRMIQNVNILDKVWADRVERYLSRGDVSAPYEIRFFVWCGGRMIQQLDPNCTRTKMEIERLGKLWFAKLSNRLPVVVRALDGDAAKRWRTTEYGVDVDFIEPGSRHEDAVGGYVCNFGRFTLAHSLNSILHFNMLKRFSFDERDQSSVYLPAVMSHEMGHVFGLGHSNEPGSVLTPQFMGVLKPSESDYEALARTFAGPLKVSRPEPEVPPPSDDERLDRDFEQKETAIAQRVEQTVLRKIAERFRDIQK